MTAKVTPNLRRRANLMAECNFASLKEKELEACFYYEYARELKSLRDAVRKFPRTGTFGADFGKPIRRKELAELLGKGSILKRRLVSLLVGSGFPKPWQLLEEARKEQLMETLPEAMAVLEVRKALCMIQWDPALFGLREFRRQVVEQVAPGRVIAGGFAVNLAAGRVAIEREFKRWLDRELRRGEEMWGAELKYFRRGPGPIGWRIGLNQLGALRWRYQIERCGLTFREARALPDWKRALPLYSDQSNFNRACAGAIRHLRELFPNERPIHR